MALGKLLGIRIDALCPPIPSPNFYSKNYSRLYSFSDTPKKVIKIMWSRIGCSEQSEWSPNHFVPLVSRDCVGLLYRGKGIYAADFFLLQNKTNAKTIKEFQMSLEKYRNEISNLMDYYAGNSKKRGAVPISGIKKIQKTLSKSNFSNEAKVQLDKSQAEENILNDYV